MFRLGRKDCHVKTNRELVADAVEGSGIGWGKFEHFAVIEDEYGIVTFSMVCSEMGGRWIVYHEIPSDLQSRPGDLLAYLSELNERATPPEDDLSGVSVSEEAVRALKLLDEGPGDESDQVAFIEMYLMSDDQRQYLQRNNLTVSQVLGGRVPSWIGRMAYPYLFNRWNAILGKGVYGF